MQKILNLYDENRKLIGTHVRGVPIKEGTVYLNSLGVDVLRFSNLDIQTNFDGVCVAINAKVNENTLISHLR